MLRIENANRSAADTSVAAQAGGSRRPPHVSGRALAARPGGLRDLAEHHLRAYPGASQALHQIGKVPPQSSGAVANALNKSPMP